MDDERLKAGGTVLTQQYFEEQLQRVREIRLSERKLWKSLMRAHLGDYEAAEARLQKV